MTEAQVVPCLVDYRPRRQFVPFHARWQRFACIVTHRRAGKTVACIHELHRGATESTKVRPRFAYISPFLRQSKAVAWDYLRAAIAPGRRWGASAHESELRIDYAPNGGQVRLYGADNPDAMRGIYLDGVVLDEYADMDPRLWSEIIRPALADRQGWVVFIGTPEGHNAFFELWRRSQAEPGWYSLMLKASDTGLIPATELLLPISTDLTAGFISLGSTISSWAEFKYLTIRDLSSYGNQQKTVCACTKLSERPITKTSLGEEDLFPS